MCRQTPFLDCQRQAKNGVTVWSAVEPLAVRFEIDIDGTKVSPKKSSNHLKSRDLSAVPKSEIEVQIKTLVVCEKLELSEIPGRLGVSLSTVRRVCRTLKIGPYGLPSGDAIASRSSQPPFGWDLINGHLRRNKQESAWIEKIRSLRHEGQSLHRIAALLEQKKVPTKNGGRWFAKTVNQILAHEFNQT